MFTKRSNNYATPSFTDRRGRDALNKGHFAKRAVEQGRLEG